jgi:hypothetical protein
MCTPLDQIIITCKGVKVNSHSLSRGTIPFWRDWIKPLHTKTAGLQIVTWNQNLPNIFFIFLYFQLDTLFFRLRPKSAILFPLHVSGLTGPSSGVRSQRPHDKDICSGGEYHRLHVQFRPPDDGPVWPETCRGKRIADIVRRRKKTVYQVGNKENKLYWDARSAKYQDLWTG